MQITDEFLNDILNTCTVYPKAEKEKIEKEAEKLLYIINAYNKEISNKKLKKQLASTIDFKQIMESNGEWIKYTKK